MRKNIFSIWNISIVHTTKMRNELSLTTEMRRFSEVIEELRLKDLSISGGQFTWCGGLNSQAASRLDHFLVSDKWEDHFTGVFQCSLPRIVSDHCPISLEGGGVKKGKTPFHFENMWLLSNGFKELVRE